ncbi:iron complex transport system permease protein [Amaricoccus macauensis]|uniref:Iron complex transport system permease protein n=1 Tax=Amaricoccus macauensis TaxID=57001 RepID=A0A840SIY9_9RHOB|nr:iron chelate uptake ABC transporter family permease subunit [Amaricoccus macauensis]MBB5221837.1 iron complex transport system permease protein [Amaricoccus macauensis]
MPRRRLALLAALTLLAALAFMLVAPQGNWSFLLGFRGERLAALALVGASVGVATVLFQTVAGNRILTPSIMGFDALYGLFQTGLVFLLGGVGYAALDARLKFLIETAAMVAAAVMLLTLLLGRGRTDLHRMLLVGVILGTFFRSLAGMLQRLMDPNEFAVVQGASFATFSRVRGELLMVAALLALVALWLAWRQRHALDVVALGRSVSIGLGIDHDRLCQLALVVVAVLVSASTALVGPVAFFGLIVASLAHVVMRTPRHAHLLPAAAMIGATILIAGQTVFERALGLQATLSVVIEFAGGLLFLFLLLRGRPA